jgi:hypothetical protein
MPTIAYSHRGKLLGCGKFFDLQNDISQWLAELLGQARQHRARCGFELCGAWIAQGLLPTGGQKG